MRSLVSVLVIAALLAPGCKKPEPLPELEPKLEAKKPEPKPEPSLADWLTALAKDPASVGKPGPSAIDADLAVIAKIEDPAQKAVDLAKLTEKVIAECSPATKAFEATAAAAPAQKTQILAQGLAEAVKAEGCKVDQAALRAAVWAMAAPAPAEAEKKGEASAESDKKTDAPAEPEKK